MKEKVWGSFRVRSSFMLMSGTREGELYVTNVLVWSSSSVFSFNFLSCLFNETQTVNAPFFKSQQPLFSRISSIKLWYQTTAVKHLFYELNSDVKARSLTCWVTDSHSVMMEWLDLTCQTSTLSSHERCFKTEWASNVFQNLRQFVPSVLP